MSGEALRECRGPALFNFTKNRYLVYSFLFLLFFEELERNLPLPLPMEKGKQEVFVISSDEEPADRRQVKWYLLRHFLACSACLALTHETFCRLTMPKNLRRIGNGRRKGDACRWTQTSTQRATLVSGNLVDVPMRVFKWTPVRFAWGQLVPEEAWR